MPSGKQTDGGNQEAVTIRASEVGQYEFCHQAWWLGSVCGYPSQNQAALAGGRQAHQQHGYTVAAALRWQLLGYGLLAAAVLLIILVAYVWMGGNL